MQPANRVHTKASSREGARSCNSPPRTTTLPCAGSKLTGSQLGKMPPGPYSTSTRSKESTLSFHNRVSTGLLPVGILGPRQSKGRGCVLEDCCRCWKPSLMRAATRGTTERQAVPQASSRSERAPSRAVAGLARAWALLPCIVDGPRRTATPKSQRHTPRRTPTQTCAFGDHRPTH